MSEKDRFAEDHHLVEGLLSDALHPVEPPREMDGFEQQIAAAVSGLADRAGELAADEKLALHNPRSWVKPAVAVAVGGLTATAATIAFIGRRRRRAGRRFGDLQGRLKPRR